jgi:hypothetical protein
VFSHHRRKSLAIRWLEAVLDELQRLVAWPVSSLKLDDLYAEFKAREARDACRLSYRLTVGLDASVSAVTVASGGGACAAPLMVPAANAAGVTTQLISVGAGATASVQLPGLKWNVAPKRR